MKNYLLLSVLMLFSASLFAQDDIVISASKKTTMEATPKKIIDSLKKRFPNAKSIQSFKTTSNAAKNGWTVTEEDNIDSSEDIDQYTLSFKREDFQYYALFKADGTLLWSKFEQYGVTLPDAAKQSLKKLAGSDYVNYKLLSDTYYRTIDHNKEKSYYEIIAVNKANANDKKKITMDEMGTVIKVK